MATGATTVAITECCGAEIVITNIDGTTWGECAACGSIVAAS